MHREEGVRETSLRPRSARARGYRRAPAWRVLAAATLLAGLLGACGGRRDAAGPSKLTVGTLYASTGAYAASSEQQYSGLRFWANSVDSSGGVYVKAYRRKIPVRIVALNDESSTALAATDALELIQQDHVDVLVSDFGSVLTSVIVPLAQENGVLLFDPTGTSPGFFTYSIFGNGDPDIVLTSLPSSSVWPEVLAHYLVARHYPAVGIVYDANTFSEAQAETVENEMGAAGEIPTLVESVPTSDQDYTPVLKQMLAAHVQALLEFGYSSNDVSFLEQLSPFRSHLPFVFTIWPGLELSTFESAVGASALDGTYTYIGPPLLRSTATFGLSTEDFVARFAHGKQSNLTAIDVAGYVAGLAVQGTLARAPSLTTEGLRTGAHELSGHMTTLAGPFVLDSFGEQVGELMPLGRITDVAGRAAVTVAATPGRGSPATGGASADKPKARR